MMPHFLTTEELAKELRVSERHISRLQAQGSLPPPIYVGKCLRWNANDFIGWQGTKSRTRKGKDRTT